MSFRAALPNRQSGERRRAPLPRPLQAHVARCVLVESVAGSGADSVDRTHQAPHEGPDADRSAALYAVKNVKSFNTEDTEEKQGGHGGKQYVIPADAGIHLK